MQKLARDVRLKKGPAMLPQPRAAHSRSLKSAAQGLRENLRVVEIDRSSVHPPVLGLRPIASDISMTLLERFAGERAVFYSVK